MDEVQLDTEVMALSGDVTADVTALQAEIARLQAQGQTQAAMIEFYQESTTVVGR